MFFARGRRAYRVVEVPPDTYQNGALRLDDAELIGLAQLVACGLKQAGCDRPQLRPALTVDGYVALETIGRAFGLVRFEPLVEAPKIVGRACIVIRRLASDSQGRALYEGCQVSAHFFNVVTYALGCAGARPCRQWAINASAADIRRTAAIMRQIASQLISGDCRTAWSRNATRDDQLGQALVLYGRSLLVRNGSTRRQEQARAGRLTEQAERLAVPVPALLETCAPHGQALGRPELT